MSNISDCIINMQFMHVDKHNLKIKSKLILMVKRHKHELV